MSQLLLWVKVALQCAVAIAPGGLVLIGLYHWRKYQRTRRLRRVEKEKSS